MKFLIAIMNRLRVSFFLVLFSTMASCAEAMGMTLPYSSSSPAESPEKQLECESAGKYIMNLLEKDIKPRDIMTREAFENAIVSFLSVGFLFKGNNGCMVGG